MFECVSCYGEVELTEAKKDAVAKLPNFNFLVRRKATQKQQQLIPERLSLDNLNRHISIRIRLFDIIQLLSCGISDYQ
jgi:hypothetical protein